MPDRNLNPPQTWSDAFAQLPQETPPADGWARMAATLAAHRGASMHAGDAGATTQAPPSPATPAHIGASPRRRLVAHPARHWAIAAMLAIALPLGLWLSLRAQRPMLETQSPNPIAHGAAQRNDGATPRGVEPGDAASATTDTRRSDAVASHPSPATANPLITDTAHADPKRVMPKAAGLASTQRPQTTLAHKPNALEPDRNADTRGPRSQPAPERIATSSSANVTPPLTGDATTLIADVSNSQRETRFAEQLRDLQTESAQLEALVTLTRDDRVASASAAVMSSDLDQRLSLIDAALTDAALPAEQRLSLWRQRVGALRSLAGVESTQRWFAARGERYEDALVRVD
jgi:hypothetical protein